jgi:hypothetical protein
MKGFFGDLITMICVLFFFGIFFLIMLYVASVMGHTGLDGIDNAMFNVYGAIKSLNTLAPMFVLAVGAGLMLSALMVRSYPILFFVFFITQLVAIVVSFPLANAYASLALDPQIGTVAADMNLWGFIFQVYPIITTVLAIIFAIAVFAFGGNE